MRRILPNEKNVWCFGYSLNCYLGFGTICSNCSTLPQGIKHSGGENKTYSQSEGGKYEAIQKYESPIMSDNVMHGDHSMGTCQITGIKSWGPDLGKKIELRD